LTHPTNIIIHLDGVLVENIYISKVADTDKKFLKKGLNENIS